MNEVDVKEWRDFKVGDLFRIEKVYGKPINKYDDGDTLYVTGSGVDNGVVGHVNAPDADISKANCISVDPIKGFACWQGTDFVGRGFSGASINLLRHDDMSEMSGLFVCSVIEAVIIGEAAYSDLFTGQRLSDTIIKLPVTPDGEPDWDYMESYMQAVMDRQAHVIESLSKISKEKHPVPMKLWGGFMIKDLFHKLDLKCRKNDFSKSMDCSETRDDEFCLPLVNAKHYDNGIQYYGRPEDWDSAEMTIDIVSNGAVATGDVFAQPQRTGVLWDAYLIKPNHEEQSEYTLNFLACVIQKCVKQFFGYNNKCTWDKVKEKTIMLPVTTDGKPDWDYMDDYMRGVMERQAHVVEHLMKMCAGQH